MVVVDNDKQVEVLEARRFAEEHQLNVCTTIDQFSLISLFIDRRLARTTPLRTSSSQPFYH